MTNAFRELAKQRQPEIDPTYGLMCTAHGCPIRWSVDPGRLCSYHASQDPKDWPSITEALNRDGPWKLFPVKPVDTTSYPGDPRAWAKRLRDRDQAGEHLTPFQRSMYQAALHLELEPA